MTTINTLIPDIQELLRSKKEGWFNDALSARLSKGLASRLQSSLGEQEVRRTLRLSQMGPRCPRALWYSVHHPELAEALPPWVEVKFAFGHIIEELAITLARAAGHRVEGEQDALQLEGIVGHRDCVIDGAVVDVKSASSIAFNKYRNRTFAETDTFGYLDQLDGYVLASNSDAIVSEKGKGYLFAIDKQLGHMCLYEHEVTPARELALRERIKAYKEIVALATPPQCECGTVKDERTGNIRLDTRASYSPFKFSCVPNLRAFIGPKGPTYYTKVVRKPTDTYKEVNKDGQAIYS